MDNLIELHMRVGVHDPKHRDALREAFGLFASRLNDTLARRPEAQYGLRRLDIAPSADHVAVCVVCTANGPLHSDVAVAAGAPEMVSAGWLMPVTLTVSQQVWIGEVLDIHVGATETIRATAKVSDRYYPPRQGLAFTGKPLAEPGDVITLSGEWSDGPSPKALELSKKYAKETR